MTPSQWFSITGLGLDLIGALFIGYEVFKRFRGEVVQRKSGIEHVDVGIPEITEDYQRWESRKHKVMAAGLAMLASGFVLQIIGVYLTGV